jgi:hypothetical protein
VGGGVESGSFSPVSGLTLELRGDPAARARAAELLVELAPRYAGAPPVTLGPAGSGAVEIGRGEDLAREPGWLDRVNRTRALEERGALFRGSSVSYAGRYHDALPTPSEASELLGERGSASSSQNTGDLRKKVREPSTIGLGGLIDRPSRVAGER